MLNYFFFLRFFLGFSYKLLFKNGINSKIIMNIALILTQYYNEFQAEFISLIKLNNKKARDINYLRLLLIKNNI